MSTEIIPFEFEGAPLRGINIDGESWFVLADVCRVLEISKHRDAATRLDDDERGSVVVDTLGGPQETIIINESGLYNLIFGSRKTQAKQFRKWVTTEVLPAIRRTGRYEATNRPQTVAYEALLEVHVQTIKEKAALEDEFLEVKKQYWEAHAKVMEDQKVRKNVNAARALARSLLASTEMSDEEIARKVEAYTQHYMPEWVAWFRRTNGKWPEIPAS